MLPFGTSPRYAQYRCAVCMSHWFEPSLGSQEKRPFSNGLFSIQSEGLVCNLTAGEYVIAEGVWHHASACILLRIDYIQHYVLIPYRRQAADSIHVYDVIITNIALEIINGLCYNKTSRAVAVWQNLSFEICL